MRHYKLVIYYNNALTQALWAQRCPVTCKEISNDL